MSPQIPETDDAVRGREVRSVQADRRPRPQVAQRRHHQAADLVRGRPARRQPGADRADGLRPQDADVQAALRHGLQGDRDRLPGRVGDRLRVRARADREEDDPGRRHHPGADAEPARADRAHLRGLPRRQARHRPSLQLDLDPAAPRRVRPGLCRHHRHRRVGRQAGQAAGRRRSRRPNGCSSIRPRASPAPSSSSRATSAPPSATSTSRRRRRR